MDEYTDHEKNFEQIAKVKENLKVILDDFANAVIKELSSENEMVSDYVVGQIILDVVVNIPINLCGEVNEYSISDCFARSESILSTCMISLVNNAVVPRYRMEKIEEILLRIRDDAKKFCVEKVLH